jgi:methylmalonyl-CoA mutase
VTQETHVARQFPTPSRGEWEALARGALKGAPIESLTRIDHDGLLVPPLHSAETAEPALFAPRTSDADGRAWDLRSLVEDDDPAAANALILAELQGGAASVLIAGAISADPEPLGRALNGVALELAPVGLDAGLDGPQAANALAVVAKGSPRARLMFHLDPLSDYAANGGSPRSIEDHIALAANTAARHAGAYPEASLFLAGGRVVHEAGGTIAQELGFAAAAALAYARAGQAAGLSLEQAVTGTVLGVAVDAEYLDALAKVRALRLIWRTLSRVLGVETPARIEARSSHRMLGVRDPWPNLLRLTAAGFAGAVGGADAVVLDGFTRARGRPDAFALRQARNTQLVLMEEAHLGRVDDPAAGSWFLDTRTRQLAQAGWAEFQRIEAEGGIVAALRAGAIQARVAEARARLEAGLVEGRVHRIGVTRFIDPAPASASVAGVAAEPARPPSNDAIAPLSPIRLGEVHEAALEASA